MASPILALSPLVSIIFASGYHCGFRDFSDGETNLIRIIVSITAGYSGWQIGKLDADIQALFYGSTFMVGSGWVIVSRFCNPTTRFIHSLLTFIVTYACIKKVTGLTMVCMLPLMAWCTSSLFLRFADLLRKV